MSDDAWPPWPPPDPPQPGRWVWVPDDDPDGWRRRLADTLPHIGQIRELNRPGLPRERKAALHDEILAEIGQEHTEELAAEPAAGAKA